MLQYLLKKFGKKYTIDSEIPKSRIRKEIYNRGIMLLRGILRTRKIIFLGKNVSINNKSNINFGKGTVIENYCKIDGYAKEKIQFGESSKLGSYSILTVTSHLSKYGRGFKIGNNSAMGEFCHIGASGGVYIGNNVIMGQYISFHSENHIFIDSNKDIVNQGVTSKGINLGNNIWVGSKVTFLDGAKVGNNCVIAAGAIVNKEFPCDCVIGGVPAKVIKYLR
ncbi:acyltransferase [Apibacter muscae]|uniref:acyltransferase n=1 Tax=Apibacter muscae TaxID=2509004 RepID=UPI0011AD8C04|nr:acyltransferase [Apibacter muscae]TWP23745.1 acyltransferase [Apibacter muscae]